jgi:hypothetical protein
VTKQIENEVFENDRSLRKQTVKSGRSERVCEIELIWTNENLGRLFQTTVFGVWAID